MEVDEFTGQQYGEWTVLRFSHRKDYKPYLLCQCACGTIKPVAQYSLLKGKSTQCRKCSSTRKDLTDEMRRKAHNLSVRKRKHLTENYDYQGIDLETRNIIANRICECCGLKSQKTLVVDHCHQTGKVRGLLCSACNLGIGHLGDNLSGVSKAYSYLQRAEDNPDFTWSTRGSYTGSWEDVWSKM